MNGYKNNYHLERRFHEFADLRELLRESSEKYSDKIAFITKVKGESRGGHTYINTTYKELFESLNYLGTALWEKGFAGERIALIGENSYYWCLGYFAVASGLGVVVPLDKLLQKEELESLLIRSGATAVFCDRKHLDVIEEIKSEGKTKLKLIIGIDCKPDGGESVMDLLIRGEELVNAGSRDFIDAPIDREALTYLLFTSGTTSASKAVMLSQKNVMSVNYYMNLEEVFFPDDVSIHLLPLHHCYGMGGMLIFLSQGITNVFCDGLKYITINLKEYGVSVMMTVPLLLENMYRKIMKAVEKQGMTEKVEKAKRMCNTADKFGIHVRRKVFSAIIEQLGGRMRCLINGAAALDPVVSKGFNDFGILTVQGYGLTECSPTIASESYRYLKPGSVGKMMPHMDYMIDEPDEAGIGELMVRGDNIMMGYYDDPAATSEVLKDGWLRTGDLAYFDKDGYLFITGRKKNVIVMKNGKNVFPEEIENLVNKLSYIEESMVFVRNKATDSVLWIKAVYSEEYLKENDMDYEKLEKIFAGDMDKINQGMPSYKMIKHFLLSDRPTVKTTTAKTKRNDELREIKKELKEKGL